jgi:hypothetical protein
MIYKKQFLTDIFSRATSPRLLCLSSGYDKYKEGETWQVIDGVLCRIFPSFLKTQANGLSGVWQVLEEKSLEEQIKELLG